MTTPVKHAQGRPGLWLQLGVIAAAATLAGLLLPQFIPGDAVLPPPAKEVAAKSGGLSYAPPAWPEAPSNRELLIRLGVGTAVVLGLCVVTLLAGRRWLAGLSAAKPGGGTMHVVETLHLGNRCCLHLIQLPSRQFLVGADGAGIKTVLPLTENFDNLLTEAAADGPRAAA